VKLPPATRPREVIVLAVRWYLRYGLSYRDVEELLASSRVRHEVPQLPMYPDSVTRGARRRPDHVDVGQQAKVDGSQTWPKDSVIRRLGGGSSPQYAAGGGGGRGRVAFRGDGDLDLRRA
jgi:hypothetical protein